MNSAVDQAEIALLDSINICRIGHFAALADNLLMLVDLQSRKGDYRGALVSAEESPQLYQQHNHSYGVAQVDKALQKVKAHLQ